MVLTQKETTSLQVLLFLAGLSLAAFLAGSSPAYASSSQWELLEADGNLDDSSAGFSSSAINPKTGELYAAFYGGATLSIKKYNGFGWEAVGGTSEIQEFYGADIAFNSQSGAVYIAYSDFEPGTFRGKIIVKKLNGTNWEAVGSEAFPEGNGDYFHFSVSPLSGEPYVACMDRDDSDRIVVKKYSGGSWQTVGQSGSLDTQSWQPFIAFQPSTGEPYLTYTHELSAASNLFVKKFDGTSWTSVGSFDSSVVAGLYQVNLAFQPQTLEPYIAYLDYNQDFKATVKRFDGSVWQAVGASVISDHQANGLKLGFHPMTNEPYVAYIENEASAEVRKFNGSSWEAVGSAFSFTLLPYSVSSFNINPLNGDLFLAILEMDQAMENSQTKGFIFKNIVASPSSVSHTAKKLKKKKVTYSLENLSVKTKKSWVKAWLGSRKVKVMSARKRGNTLRVTIRLNYKSWPMGNYNLRVTYKNKVGKKKVNNAWYTLNALSVN
ncbi:MAG: hypothetical protein WC858_02395 [Parcubacteria group bacterium]|jgi:hypothetical protein